MSASGQSKIEEFHAPLFATIFKNSHQTLTDIKIRFVRADVAAVDVRWEMTGTTDAQGNAGPLRQGLLNFVMAKNDGKWLIVVRPWHSRTYQAGPASWPLQTGPSGYSAVSTRTTAGTLPSVTQMWESAGCLPIMGATTPSTPPNSTLTTYLAAL
jgi:hypothetical protein